jgi:FHA domain
MIMSKPPRKLKGRPATDERGNATWKWGGESETEIETTQVKALAEGLSLEPPPEKGHPDPYNQSTSQGKAATRGRSLDDMRRLNEEMKREHEKLVRSLRQRPVKKSASHPPRGMRLRLDDRELLVDERHASITIGRGEDNDVAVSGERISRVHARIEISRNAFVLIDQSTNGTFVRTADGKESLVHRDSLQLKGQGMIGLGRRPVQGAPHTLRFSCEEL